MKKGKFVKKLVPATTTNKQKHIIAFLLSQGHSASRINTTGIYDKSIEAYRKTGARVGHSDISGVFKSRFKYPSGHNIGIAFYIEGKFTETDSLSDEQIEFLDEVSAAGALTFVAESVECFDTWYNHIKQLYL